MACSDTSRLRILNLIMSNGEMCISDLERILEFTQAKTSRHLIYLKNSGILSSRKLNQWVFYQIKEEVLDRMILFGEKMLRHCVAKFILHYHAERNHQGHDNKLIEPEPSVGSLDGEVVCRERLGGLLNYYHRVPTAKAA